MPLKVALIQPSVGNIICPPLNIAYLSAYLRKHGYDARLFDFQIPQNETNFPEDIKIFAPDLIGITAMTPQIKQAAEIAKKIQNILGYGIPIILGGIHGSVLPEETLRRYPLFNAVAIGEGELTILEICRCIENSKSLATCSGIAFMEKTGNIVIKKRNDYAKIDELPFPHGEYDFDHYLQSNCFIPHGISYGAIMGSRGCPFPCTFCAANRYGHRYRARKPHLIIQEMSQLKARGAKGAYFLDSTFMINRNWCKEFCEEVSYLNFPWCVDGRVDLVDEELLTLMNSAGCHAIFYGVESGSQKILDYYRKGITVERIIEVFDLMHKVGIRSTASFILGAPIETRDDIKETINLIYRIRPSYYGVGILSPMPGSKIYTDLANNGYHFDYENLTRDHATFQATDLSKEKLNDYLKELKDMRKHICSSWIDLT